MHAINRLTELIKVDFGGGQSFKLSFLNCSFKKDIFGAIG